MEPIIALTVLFCVYAAGELIAQKSKAVFSTVLGIAILLLAGFWSGILPRSVIEDAQVTGFGNVIAGILIVSLGTTIDFPELRRQWKVVVTALVCVVGATLAIILIGYPLIGKEMALSVAPIFAGGSAATLIMTTALDEMGLVAVAAHFLSELTGGVIHYFVLCLVMGAVFFALGFLEKGIMSKTQSGGLITFFVTILIFSNLATTTPQQVLSVLPALLLSAACGVAGTVLLGFICAKVMNFPFGLAVSFGISCTFGFPTTMLIPQEVAEAFGRTETEKAAILNYLLPKMLTAGFVTVTIASVLIAGVVVRML